MAPSRDPVAVEELVTTFASEGEMRKAEAVLTRLGLPYRVVSPNGYSRAIPAPALVLDGQSRRALYAASESPFACAGWVEYRAPAAEAQAAESAEQAGEDVFGTAHIMVLQPCVAAPEKLRFVAHLTGDLGPVFPYMNAVMPGAFYNENGPTFTFMDGYRMITAYPRRVAVAKADDIVDVWRVLWLVRSRANECWAARSRITPSTELRRKPPALEIYYRLPKTNCGACGEKTCMAFALRLWSGQCAPSRCAPVFSGAHAALKDALLEICAGLAAGTEQP